MESVARVAMPAKKKLLAWLEKMAYTVTIGTMVRNSWRTLNMPWAISKWYTPAWYKYLFDRQYVGKQRPTLRMILCRMREHPYPVVWYNLSGDEPNMDCTNCGEDLG